jgi:carbamoyltransferase
LGEGKIIGWFQGRMEFGPRALGNRSILSDSRKIDMQKILNQKIKYRESFRPFAPSVLAEDAKDYFELDEASPYMLLVSDIIKARRKARPVDFFEREPWERLDIERSDMQCITHLDYSARVHTVHSDTNAKFWKLINAFKNKTGYSVIVNTSFNVRGEPIVCTPEDAYRCFMNTEIDCLVMNNFVLMKTDQKTFENRDEYRTDFILD